MEFIAQVFQRDLEHTASVFIPSRRWKVISQHNYGDFDQPGAI